MTTVDNHDPAAAAPPSRVMVMAAYAAIYIVWGSTYLAIKYAVETVPPFLMTGVRFLIAGGILYAWSARPSKAARLGSDPTYQNGPTSRAWRPCARPASTTRTTWSATKPCKCTAASA